MTSFTDWLLVEMKKRGWNQSELAAQAGVSKVSISDVLSGRRKVGQKLAVGIAMAFKMPPEAVMRKAGMLPPERGNVNSQIDEILHRTKDLDEHDRNAILEFIDMLDRLRPKRKNKK